MRNGHLTTRPALGTKVLELWGKGYTSRQILKEIPPIGAEAFSALKKSLGIAGINPNIPKKESKYGISHKEDSKEYGRQRYKAKFKEIHGYSMDEPRLGMSGAFYDKDMNLYACSCANCKNVMLWPLEFFAPPTTVHYKNPKKYASVLKRGCINRTIQCVSHTMWKLNQENIEFNFYIRYRSMRKDDGLPVSKLKSGGPMKDEDGIVRTTRYFNMRDDKQYHAFKKKFDVLEKNKDGNYICPVYNIPMFRTYNPDAKKGYLNAANSPSVDRIDSFLPHTLDNIQIISWIANNHKGNASPEQMIQQGKYYQKLKDETNL